MMMVMMMVMVMMVVMVMMMMVMVVMVMMCSVVPLDFASLVFHVRMGRDLRSLILSLRFDKRNVLKHMRFYISATIVYDLDDQIWNLLSFCVFLCNSV